MLIKDLSPVSTRVDIVLADRNVRASIATFDEPFRVVVDLFDREFNQPHDPSTGLPMVSVDQGARSNQHAIEARDDRAN